MWIWQMDRYYRAWAQIGQKKKAKMKVSGSVERSHNMNTTRNCQMREKVLEVSKKFVM